MSNDVTPSPLEGGSAAAASRSRHRFDYRDAELINLVMRLAGISCDDKLVEQFADDRPGEPDTINRCCAAGVIRQIGSEDNFQLVHGWWPYEAPYRNKPAAAGEAPCAAAVSSNQSAAPPVQMEAVRSSCEVDWRASYIRARDALYQFQYPPDPKMLREIADEIDCGSDCEHGHTEWDTNAHVCSRSDRGECTGEKAWHLRQFADAIEARAEIVDPLAPHAQRDEVADDLEPGELLPCPFCGGEAEILEFDEPDFDEEHENFGGSCVVCKKCQANTAVVFGYKETLHSSWNERKAAPALVPAKGTGEAVAVGYVRERGLEQIKERPSVSIQLTRDRIFPGDVPLYATPMPVPPGWRDERLEEAHKLLSAIAGAVNEGEQRLPVGLHAEGGGIARYLTASFVKRCADWCAEASPHPQSDDLTPSPDAPSDAMMTASEHGSSPAAASKSREHDIKCWPEFFKHLWSGKKTFEIRKDDREYQAGDTLLLREWTERSGYSGRWIKCDVPFVLGGLWPGLAPNHVCMSIKEIERSRPQPAAAVEAPCAEDVRSKTIEECAKIAERENVRVRELALTAGADDHWRAELDAKAAIAANIASRIRSLTPDNPVKGGGS